MEEQAVEGLPWHELAHWERETTSTVGYDEVSQTPHKERAQLDGPRVHKRGPELLHFSEGFVSETNSLA